LEPPIHENFRRFVAPMVMLMAVIALYLPPGTAAGRFELLGTDYLMLHQHRIDFAQSSLANGTLPAWYSRELCGSPFWSNVQNFPFIPTRLALLWLAPANLFPGSVIVSAVLSAMFTFCFARRLGMGSVGSAVAGWTFAASGFFASRIAAGHLPLLEAYPALPLLLWLVDRAAEPLTSRRWLDARLITLGLATAAVSLAGHPQLWVYALCIAILYAVVRCRWRRSIWVIGALLAGLGCASFALWPMAQLIGRSTRVLPLVQATNDLAMPYGRLLAAFAPWRDGFPLFSPYVESQPLKHYPHAGYFWDTVWYMGLLPWVATLSLLVLWIAGKVRGDRRTWFVVAISVAALALALPWVRDVLPETQGTFLRSPARLVYITVLGLSLAGGAAACRLARWATQESGHRLGGKIALAAVILLHGIDLGRHDRHFIIPSDEPLHIPPDVQRQIVERVGTGRVAIDLTIPVSINRKFDDVSFFDSIMLARSYRGIMAMKGAPAGYNNQAIPAFAMDARILRTCGAGVLMTFGERARLPLWHQIDALKVYKIEGAAPRANWFPLSLVAAGSDADAERALREKSFDPTRSLVVEDPSAPPATRPSEDRPINVNYERRSSDAISIDVNAPAEGWLEILEAFDPGWQATINGKPAAVVPANLMFMAVRVGAGPHVIELTYHTPGRDFGLLLSVVGLLGLVGIALVSPRFDRQPAIAQKLLNERLDPLP